MILINSEDYFLPSSALQYGIALNGLLVALPFRIILIIAATVNGWNKSYNGYVLLKIEWLTFS